MHVNKLNSSYVLSVMSEIKTFRSFLTLIAARPFLRFKLKLYVFGSFVLTVASEKIDDQFWRHLGKNLLKGSRT